MARPIKLNPEIMKRIGDNIALGMSLSSAAEAAGITYKTLNLWKKKGENDKKGIYFEFSEHIAKRNADCVRINMIKIAKAAHDGSWQAAAWILERRFLKILDEKPALKP